MAQRRRGLSEKTYFAFNPLPAITDAEVLKRAGLDDLMAAVKPLPFAISWKYGGTLEDETVRLPPGEMCTLRGDLECTDFRKAWDDQGLVILEDPDDMKEVKTKTIEGLQKAVKFWTVRGKKRLIEIRKTHGYGKDEMEDFRYDHWVYYANQAKADFIADELKRLRRPERDDDVVATATTPKRK